MAGTTLMTMGGASATGLGSRGPHTARSTFRRPLVNFHCSRNNRRAAVCLFGIDFGFLRFGRKSEVGPMPTWFLDTKQKDVEKFLQEESVSMHRDVPTGHFDPKTRDMVKPEPPPFGFDAGTSGVIANPKPWIQASTKKSAKATVVAAPANLPKPSSMSMASTGWAAVSAVLLAAGWAKVLAWVEDADAGVAVDLRLDGEVFHTQDSLVSEALQPAGYVHERRHEQAMEAVSNVVDAKWRDEKEDAAKSVENAFDEAMRRIDASYKECIDKLEPGRSS